METIVFKNVYCSKSDKLVSDFVGWYEEGFAPFYQRIFTRIYDVGKVTLPVEGTKLFAWSNYSDAEREFGGRCHHIYKAKAINVVRHPGLEHYYETKQRLIRSLQEIPLQVDFNCWKSGILVCDSIELLERIL